MAIYKSLNEISEASTKMKIMCGMFCDLHKTFNCVNHGIPLSILAFFWNKRQFSQIDHIIFTG